MELPNIIFLIVTLVLTINLIKLIPKSILDSITTTQNFDSYLKNNFNQPGDSQNSDQPFHVIYLILSARENFSRRKIIRETWAKEHLSQVYFLVGNYCPIHPYYRERFTCEFKKDSRFTDRINDIEKENDKFNHFQTSWKLENEKWNQNYVNDSSLEFEPNIIFFKNMNDTYRNLPEKLKLGFKSVIDLKPTFIVKIDDDMFVRISQLNNMLKNKYNFMKLDKTNLDKKLVIGNFRSLKIGRKPGRNQELEYGTTETTHYPPFPIGSYGYVVNYNWANYVVRNSEKLKNYQGEDVSTGIWMEQFWQEEKDNFSNKFWNKENSSLISLSTKFFTNDADCFNRYKVIIGHRVSESKMELCYITQIAKESSDGKLNFDFEV